MVSNKRKLFSTTPVIDVVADKSRTKERSPYLKKRLLKSTKIRNCYFFKHNYVFQ